MAAKDYGDVRNYSVGDRVEFHPASDIWMRGAKFGRVTSIKLKEPDLTRHNQPHVYYIAPEMNGSELKIRIKETAAGLKPA